MAKIKVVEGVDGFGNQTFSFTLANGRIVKLDFCPAMIEPGGDACAAVVSLTDADGERIAIEVSETGGHDREPKSMKSVVLSFRTEEEQERISTKVRQELDALKQVLAPLRRDNPERN